MQHDNNFSSFITSWMLLLYIMSSRCRKCKNFGQISVWKLLFQLWYNFHVINKCSPITKTINVKIFEVPQEVCLSSAFQACLSAERDTVWPQLAILSSECSLNWQFGVIACVPDRPFWPSISDYFYPGVRTLRLPTF